MPIKFFGANCLSIKLSQSSLVFDDNLRDLGAKSVSTANDIACLTNASLIQDLPVAKITFDTPGDYEIENVLIRGLRARAFTDEAPLMSATIFKLLINDLAIVVCGHVQPDLNDEQLEALSESDILFVPVGGGETLDASQASQLVKDLSPKLVIPTHYQQKGLKFAAPQAPCNDFVRHLGIEAEFHQGSLKLNPSDLSEKTRLMILS